MLSALRHHRRLVFVFFLLAAAFLYFAHIDSYHLIELDEADTIVFPWKWSCPATT